MRMKIIELLPELQWVQNKELQTQVVACYEDALSTGGWEPEDMKQIPFTLLIPDCPFSYLDHVRGVTGMAKDALMRFNSIYGEKQAQFRMNHDFLVAGALLHDIGKIVEYAKNPEGKYVKSTMGKNLRHPFSGTVIALRNGCPEEVAHIIANHAHEGDGTLRSPEAVLVNKADFMNFEGVKSFLGMK